MLDLSLDVQRAKSLKDALGSFVHVDQLRGANKYKCEKCVTAPFFLRPCSSYFS